jgi:TonB family protein
LAVVLVAVPLAALVTWLAMRSPAPAPPTTEATQTMTSILSAERFDPAATLDVVEAPPLPTELEDAEATQEPVAADPKITPAPRTTPAVVARQPVEQSPSPQPISDADVKLLKAGPGVVAPRLLDLLEPPYPKPDRKEVVVVVSAFVSHTGSVLTATVKSGPSFKRRYREAALASVQRAAFDPATQDGVPGKMWVDVEVLFRP